MSCLCGEATAFVPHPQPHPHASTSPSQVSAYTDDHLPQPDVQGWRRRQRAALRQAEALIRRSLRGALAAVAAEPAAAPIAQQPAVRRCGRRTGSGLAIVLTPLPAPSPATPQVSPGEDFTFPPLPRDEWEDVYTESMHSCRASVAAAVEHAAGALQVRPTDPACLPACLRACLPACCAWGGGRALLQVVVEDAAASEVLEADEFDAATQDR